MKNEISSGDFHCFNLTKPGARQRFEGVSVVLSVQPLIIFSAKIRNTSVLLETMALDNKQERRNLINVRKVVHSLAEFTNRWGGFAARLLNQHLLDS